MINAMAAQETKKTKIAILGPFGCTASPQQDIQWALPRLLIG